MLVGMKRTAVVLAMACLAARAASAQGLTMTPEMIREAIRFGTAQKERPFYEIRRPGYVGSLYKPRLGYFSTPFTRVADAAYSAKKEYRTFGEADVTAEMLAPEVHVYGMAQAEGPSVVSVRAILITPAGARNPEAAIRPVSFSEVPVEFKNLMGWREQGASMKAVFPIAVLRPGYDVHIIYDSGVHDGRVDKFCEDCAVPLRGMR